MGGESALWQGFGKAVRLFRLPMWRLLLLLALPACTGLAWNTDLAEHPQVREEMVASVIPGVTTEGDVKARWGLPTQRIREGAQVTYVYRSMTNPPGYYVPQFGNSADYVLIEFQYGLATDVRTPATEGCRGTFPPRPPNPGFDNPSTVYAVNCGVDYSNHPGAIAARPGTATALDGTGGRTATPGVPPDRYASGGGKL